MRLKNLIQTTVTRPDKHLIYMNKNIDKHKTIPTVDFTNSKPFPQ